MKEPKHMDELENWEKIITANQMDKYSKQPV